MFKESGVAHQCSDTDSDEERAREHANRKAIKRWNKKKEMQENMEKDKKAKTPSYPTDETRKQCVGELLLIGDTSIGNAPTTHSDSYIRAYQTYKQESRAKSVASSKVESRSKSAVSIRSAASAIDPQTYDDWVATKPDRRRTTSVVAKRPEQRTRLVKQMDYQTWLEAANKRINKQVCQKKKEDKYGRDFKEWIQELKEEVGTFEYWKRRKEEQIAKEKQLAKRKQMQEQHKYSETQGRKKLVKDIYKHWAVNKEMVKLKEEEQKLQKEKERLMNLHQNRKR